MIRNQDERLRSGNPRLRAIVAAGLFFAGCGSSTSSTDDTEPGSVAERSVAAVAETTTTTVEVSDSEPVTHWPVGPEFRARSITIDGEDVPVDIVFQSFAEDSVSIVDRGNCAGGGTFSYQLADGRLTDVSGGPSEGVGCDATEPDQRVGEALDELLFGEPHVIVGADSVELVGEHARLLVTTDDSAGNVPVVPNGVRFNGESSTIDGVDASTVSLVSPAFFILTVELETCVVHTQVGGLQTVEPRNTIVGVPVEECPNPSPSDEAMLELLVSEPIIAFDDELLTVTGPTGGITLRPT